MNLNKELGIELIGEGKPYIKYPGDPLWSNISLPQMAIGYEVRITPLQTLAFYNAIANDGVLLKPKFVKALSFHGTVIKTFEPEIINNSICSHNTIQQVKKMLEGVVNSGTAVGLSNPTYKIAGKTGTAKIYDGKVGEYVNRYKASFVGYFPADKPRYSCIVMIVDPAVNGYFGSTAAAPVFREISDWVYINDLDIHQEINPADKPKKNILAANTPYVKDGYKDDIETALEQLNINSKKSNTLSSKWIVASEKTNYVQFDNRALKENIAPKVIGMGLRDAMYVLEVIGLSVEVRGRGKVVRQSINAGTPVKNGEKIIIELS